MKELLYLKDEQIKDLIEQLFYAYRETFADPKKILKKHSFGIAHQKVIHLIERYEGNNCLWFAKKIKITKQSLNRVLKDLNKNKKIITKKGEVDSRHKHILLNESGKKLSNEIFSEQKKRIYHALKNSNSEAVIKFKEVLEKIING
jgi:DNA-binding MarR family transcriptional regulator